MAETSSNMQYNFSEEEKNILKFWEDKKIFQKLLKKNQGKKSWSFLDGPITANNPMGVHHAWGRTYKDVFQRYKAMRGFDQRFQNGFDCQGLWVEVEVEKELGFKNKKDIEEYGLEKFVKKCKERVEKYSKIQTKQSIRLGQWMDWDNSYYTMSEENNYSIWHFLKKCHQNNILYKGKDVVPWCPRCGTSISQHEILTEEYQELTHQSIFFKLPLLNLKKTFFLVWTTTPWTLPANVALAVHPDFSYVKVKDKEGNIFILLKSKLDIIPQGEIVEEIKGQELIGLEYQGLFDDFPAVKDELRKYNHAVIGWEDVTEEDGTGIVHIAPGCGEEDFQLGKDFKLPVIDPTNEESRYKEGFGEISGKFVFEKETKDWIFENLKKRSFVFKIENYQHRYPTCWRCKSELIFRLVDEWYISMDSLRKPLEETARKINWIPSFGLERELDWLKNMKDWLISKKRYWGLALPIFECSKCGSFEVLGSKEELKERAVEGWSEFEGHSPHRPWVDEVKIKCLKCNSLLSRVPDVGNPWLDAGVVPFSTMKYFSDKDFWKKWFPADFICESFPGQFKNWFYSLLVLSEVLAGTKPFRTIFGYAMVVDAQGEEMHKSKGNAIWFDEAVEKIGADVMRWLYVRQNPFSNLRFGYEPATEVKRKLLILLNSYGFFETYKNPQENKEKLFEVRPQTLQMLDKWVISKLNGLIGKTTDFLDKYDSYKASLAIEDFFINDLSLWFIRRSRKRFQNPKNDKEKENVENVLYFILLTLTKLLAPMMPFLSEKMYQKLRSEKISESVHLSDWPQKDDKLIDEKLEEEMVWVRDIVNKVLAKRIEAGIKVRQPLRKLKIKNEKVKIVEDELLDLIREETNIKKIVFDDKIKGEVELDINIDERLKEEGEIREVIRHIQNLRKKEGLVPKNRIIIDCFFAQGTVPDIQNLLEKNRELILKETRANDIRFNSEERKFLDNENKLKIKGGEVALMIKIN